MLLDFNKENIRGVVPFTPSYNNSDANVDFEKIYIADKKKYDTFVKVYLKNYKKSEINLKEDCDINISAFKESSGTATVQLTYRTEDNKAFRVLIPTPFNDENVDELANGFMLINIVLNLYTTTYALAKKCNYDKLLEKLACITQDDLINDIEEVSNALSFAFFNGSEKILSFINEKFFREWLAKSNFEKKDFFESYAGKNLYLEHDFDDSSKTGYFYIANNKLPVGSQIVSFKIDDDGIFQSSDLEEILKCNNWMDADNEQRFNLAITYVRAIASVISEKTCDAAGMSIVSSDDYFESEFNEVFILLEKNGMRDI